MIKVQEKDFVVQEEYQKLLQKNTTGAVSLFVGLVRDFNQTSKRFFLQHYPAMTEKVLCEIEQQAKQRWNLIDTTIIHRVGELNVDDQIVFVGVSSAHRADAFAACEFMIDILKTRAPFWKKEGQTWVEAKQSDQHSAQRWSSQDSVQDTTQSHT